MQNKLVILALLGLTNANESAFVQPAAGARPAAVPQQYVKPVAQPQQFAKPAVQQRAQPVAQPQQFAKPAVQQHAQPAAQQFAKPATKVNASLIQKKIKGETPASEAGIFGLLNSSAAIHQDIRSQARQMDIEPPSIDQIKRNMYVPTVEDAEKDTAGIAKLMKDVKVIGGDSGKKNRSAGMTDSDVACYSGRYSDLGITPAKDHFKKIGDAQGRLETCARELSEYESLTYLHTFPELQQKFGDGASAIKQARNHYTTTGAFQTHFAEKMKDTAKTAWKCGTGAKQSCKCHGTLWYGPTVAIDDKKPIDTWDKMREWKTLTKESEEWMSCNDATFGSDPWPEQEKQCWCEDKPAYKPWKCAEDGEECLCEGGWVVYGAKVDKDKKENDFFSTIKLSLAVTGTHGKQSIKCDSNTFAGADPAPDADKVCFCDANKKFFDNNFVSATKTFWKSQALEKQSEAELKRTTEHSGEVDKVTKEKGDTAKESNTAAKVENEKAITDIASAKTCAITSIEESYKFRKSKITQRRLALEKAITKRRTQVTGWSMTLSTKKNASEASCIASGRKDASDKARLEGECKRLTEEVNELETQIQVEVEKINTEESDGMIEIRKEETSLESKRTKETIAVEEKADEDANEIRESNTERALDNAEEKEQLLQQQEELIKIQQKTSHKIEVSIKEQQDAINILVKNLRKKLTGMARKEEIFISELSSDAPERETVTKRIITRSKETVEKLTKVKTELKDKKEKITEETTSLKKEITELSEKLTTIQAKITTQNDTLKQKTMERKSKKDVLMQSGITIGEHTATSSSVMVTQSAIDKFTTEIKELREKIKKNVQQKNEYFSTKITTQKTVDLYINQVRTIETQVKNLVEFIVEVEATIKGVETKTKEEKATKKVIETQKAAFKASQTKIGAEEELNSTRVETERAKDAETAQAKDCKKKFDEESSSVKQMTDQLKTLKKTADDSKGTKEEKARLESEAEAVSKQVDDAKKELDESEKNCKEIDEDLAKVVEESATKIKKLTTKITDSKETQESAEKEAKETITELPGGEKDIEEIVKEEKETEKEETKSQKITVAVTTDKNSKTSTGKPKTPSVPAPKPKVTETTTAGDTTVTQEVTVANIVKKKEVLPGETGADDEDEDDGEPTDATPVEVPGGETQITKEVTENTLIAHDTRVDLVKTEAKLKYELTTIKAQLTKYKEGVEKTTKSIEEQQTTLKTEQAKLESMKTSAITIRLKESNSQKIELEISSQVTKITEIEASITRNTAALIEFKNKMTILGERRKQIKFTIEIKVLETKEAEAAVIEAIKTVTNVELLNRKRYIASKLVGDYNKQNKYMAEYKTIYEKQSAIIATELNEHARRIEVAKGAIVSLKERKDLLKEAKSSKDVDNQLDKIESEIERHEKIIKVEDKVITAVKEKKTKNTKEYEEHVEKITKTKSAAKVATNAVNDAATTLKAQREYQSQVTNLKNILISSHEQALTKRSEVEKVFQNYTMMITKYEEQTIIANEQIMDSKTKISGAQEIQRIVSVRMKEISTLMSRPTITSAEKTKLTTEESEIRSKMEAQENIINTETKNLVGFETSLTTLSTTIKQFNQYITEIKTVRKELEKKVKETKAALKPAKKEDEEKKEEKEDDEKDKDGDDKIDEVDEKDDEKDAVKGGNEKIDKELDQIEEENKSTTTQIDSMTKTILSVEEKSEASSKEVVKETTSTIKEESAIVDIKAEKHRLERVRERQRCGRLFPSVFSSFKIKNELAQESMCPCPASGKGLTQLYLENIKDAAEFDKFVLGLFEKNLAMEGSFESQLRRYNMGGDEKLATDTTETTRLRIVVGDDKVDEVMTALDAQNLSQKSTDFKISPLLKGKAEYQKWQQNSLTNGKANVPWRASLDAEEEDLDDELPEE